MFEVLVPTTPSKPGFFHPHRTKANPVAGVSGSVNHDRVATFAHLDGQVIRCLSGNLWVTIENDAEDHVLEQGQRLLVSAPGKVIIGGKGRYFI